MRLLYADLVHQNPGSLDAAVGSTDQGDGHPNIDVDVSLRVGLLPIHCETNGYAFKRSLRLHEK